MLPPVLLDHLLYERVVACVDLARPCHYQTVGTSFESMIRASSSSSVAAQFHDGQHGSEHSVRAYPRGAASCRQLAPRPAAPRGRLRLGRSPRPRAERRPATRGCAANLRSEKRQRSRRALIQAIVPSLAMKRLSSSWLLAVVLFTTAAGCAVPPEGGAGGEPAVTEEVSEAALVGAGAITNTCTPNGAEPPGAGTSICNASGNQVIARASCCSGRARVHCPSRGESSETTCIP
jgi:hypothetical protein